MLSRGIYDPLWMWPIVFWPLIFSSAFYAFLRLCKLSQERHGFSPLNGRYKSDAVTTYLFFPLAVAFEGVIHLYLLWVIGYVYGVMALLVYTVGWVVLPWLLEDFRPAQVLLPLVYIAFAVSFVVLLGFADVPLIRALNSELYGVLTGLPTKL